MRSTRSRTTSKRADFRPRHSHPRHLRAARGKELAAGTVRSVGGGAGAGGKSSWQVKDGAVSFVTKCLRLDAMLGYILAIRQTYRLALTRFARTKETA